MAFVCSIGWWQRGTKADPASPPEIRCTSAFARMILKPGDQVAIIAPAARPAPEDANLLEAAVTLLEAWGLSVQVRTGEACHFYLAGSDEERAAHLHAALADPGIRAIFCARGGYGCTRLFTHLDPGLRPGQKFLVGYSDITALHLAAKHLWPQVASIHGPNIATRQFLMSTAAAGQNRDALHRALFDPEYEVDAPVEFLRPGRASGPLAGGCLSLLAGALGSRFAPATDGAILLLEDVGEKPYRIDRMLVQLRNAGMFSTVRGVVFGVMHECSDDANDLRAIIRDVLAGTTFPIAFGLGAGHGETNIALSLGLPTSLDAAAGRFRLRCRA